jgi:DNA-directed RNA polymerase subunit M/transcription elongation factor TFIIS
MKSPDRDRQLRCPDCSYTEVVGLPEMLRRLQTAGMMRRAKEPDEAVIEELFVQSAGRFTCPECGRAGLLVEDADDWSDDAWGTARLCARCRQPIPPERLEVFPNSTLCAACQQAEEAAGADDQTTPEYCPRCGSIMTLRSSGVGVSRYVMTCPQCGKR